MNCIKSLVKNTRAYKVFRKYKNEQEQKRVMQINYSYKEKIDPLMDLRVLKNKCDELEEIKNSNHAKYFVIAQKNTTLGILGYINCFLPHIAYAIAMGYIPVIDMQTYDNIYIPKEHKQKQDYNAWESFFEQPMNIGLDDIRGKNIIRCYDTFWYRWMPNSSPMMSDEEIALWSAIAEKYIRLNNRSKEYVNNELNTILKEPEKTLGVIYRGTDYTKGHAKGHPVQPSMEMLADKVREFMSSSGLNKVYLASDERSIVEFMEKRFPGQILINKRVFYDDLDVDYSRYNIDGTHISGDMIKRDQNEYLIGIEYISSINLVSCCECFVGGACGGTTAAFWMNGLKYKKYYVFDLGKY